MGNYLKVCFSFGLILCAPLLASGQEPDSLDFLIFRNGATLSGTVTREGDWYALRSNAKGGDARYPVTTVLKVCKGARETYLFLKGHIQNDDPAGHCLVARFCVTYDLEPEAREEIQAALKLDRRCSDARSLLAQLENKVTKSEAAIPELPQPTVALLPAARLEDWPQIATQSGFTEYAKRIQPILLNGCGTSACHGSAEGRRAFALTRGLYGASPSPLTSRANLERILGLVDKEHPDESPLLKRALQMHGGAKSAPLLAADQSAYQQLQTWVATACGVKPEIMAKSNQSNGAVSQTGFASDEPETKAAASSAVFAAPERHDVTSATSNAKRTDPGSAAASPTQPINSVGTQDNLNRPAASSLPAIPGLSGKAASQLGQSPASQQPIPSAPGPIPDAKKQPLKNLKEDPEFLNYSHQLGVRPTIAGPDREPPRQLRMQNAGSFEVRTPPPPEIPEEYKKPPPAKEPESKDGQGKETRILNSGTIVNPPKQ